MTAAQSRPATAHYLCFGFFLPDGTQLFVSQPNREGRCLSIATTRAMNSWYHPIRRFTHRIITLSIQVHLPGIPDLDLWLAYHTILLPFRHNEFATTAGPREIAGSHCFSISEDLRQKLRAPSASSPVKSRYRKLDFCPTLPHLFFALALIVDTDFRSFEIS